MFWKDIRRRDRNEGLRTSSMRLGNDGSEFGLPPNSIGPRRQRYIPIFDDLAKGTIVEEWLPKDLRRIHKIMRGIYARDHVAGPAVDFYKELPWSEFSMVGVEDRVRQTYEDAINSVELLSWLPEAAAEFLVLGKVCIHLVLNTRKGLWSDAIIHDPDYLEVTPVPTLRADPKIDVRATPEWRAFCRSTDPRDTEVRDQMLADGELSEDLISMIMAGRKIPLDPAATLYLPRKASAYDWQGSSIYYRILNFLSLEYSLINASISGARRKAGSILHVKLGSPEYEAELSELDALRDLFMQSEEDPVGAVIATRHDVEAAYVGGAGDIWKISDEYDFLSQAKMRALGISETFLTGEATYNTMEAVMSIFLERIKAFRAMFTQKLIIQKVLAPLAVNHQFVKRTPAQLAHRIRIASSSKDYSNLLLPKIVWKKALKPHGDESYLDILDRLEAKGLPVTYRTWASAGGFDIDAEIESIESDKLLRQQIAKNKAELPPEENTETPSFESPPTMEFPEIPTSEESTPTTPEEPSTEAPAAEGTPLPGASFNPDNLRRGTTEPHIKDFLISRYERLSIWRRGEFLDLPQGEALRVLQSVLQHGESRIAMSNALKREFQVRRWSPPKRELFYYTLARVGFIRKVQLSEVAKKRIVSWIEEGDSEGRIKELVVFSRLAPSEDSDEIRANLHESTENLEELNPGPQLLTGWNPIR